MVRLDDNAQPLDSKLNQRLRADRAIHEMLGIIKGILVDGVVTDREAYALHDWFTANPDAISVWPGLVLSSRLKKILDDGRIDDVERSELHELMIATVGEQERPGTNPTTNLPLDDPQPRLIFAGKTYLFTGAFVFGVRKDCQAAVVARGGMCSEKVNHRIDVLVIGCMGSRDWIHTSYGRKIEDTVRLKLRGMDISIVDEPHWVAQLRESRQ